MDIEEIKNLTRKSMDTSCIKTVCHMQKSAGLTIKGNYKVIGKSKGERIIAGYASIAEIDIENQLITTKALEEGIKTLLDNEYFSNLNLSHNNIQVGIILKEYKNLKTHVDDKGLFIVAQIRDDLKVANEVWERILNGELRAFSIAGEIIEYHDECDDNSCFEVIDKLNIFEISVCGEPVNVKSGFTIVAKNVSKMSNKIDDIMKEKEKETCSKDSETSDETKTEETVTKTEEETTETKSEDETKTETENVAKDEKKDEEDDEDDDEDKEDKKKSSDSPFEDFDRRLTAIEEVINQTFSEKENTEESNDETKETEKSESEDESKDTETKSEDTKDEEDPMAKAIALISESLEISGEELQKALESLKSKANEDETKTETEAETETKSEENKDDETETKKSEDTEEKPDEKEFKLAIKSRDNAINGYQEVIKKLELRVKELENSEQKPKTTVTKESDNDHEKKTNYVIEHGGTIYRDE